jgi:hypothetical protein
MAGARMLSNYPSSIVVHGLGLNITVQSYHRSLDFGLMADAQAMPDVRELADAIEIAFDDIKALPLPGEAEDETPPARESAVGRARRTLAGAVNSAVGGAVTSAVSGVVSAVVGQAVSTVTGGRKRKAVAAAGTAANSDATPGTKPRRR